MTGEGATLTAMIAVGLAGWLVAIATAAYWGIAVAALVVAWAAFGVLRPS